MIVKVSQANIKKNKRRSKVDSYNLSHARYKFQYHVVFIPKYRKNYVWKLKEDVRKIIKRLCDYRNIENIEGAVCADNVHLCLSVPPSEKVSDVIAYIEGKSTIMIHDKYPEMVNGWSKAFWARGYYVVIVGNITEEVVKEYIQQQKEKIQDGKPLLEASRYKYLRHSPFRCAGIESL